MNQINIPECGISRSVATALFLNELTPDLIDMAARIARDIDPQDENLDRIISSISAQLTEQIVDWSDVPTLTSARGGRELQERLDGDASFRRIKEELDVYNDRIEFEIGEYFLIKGASAWRRRNELALMLRIDSLALVAGARRLRRIADDVRRRMPGPHLNAAIGVFDSETPSLVALRDMAEHIDQYSIGRGRKDVNLLEPGDVFKVSIDPTEVSIRARSQDIQIRKTYRTCAELIQCLANASDHHSLFYLMPPLADYDFMIHTKDGLRIVSRADETADHARERELMASALAKASINAQLPRKRCSHCNLWL
jgi:hypothetical protein